MRRLPYPFTPDAAGTPGRDTPCSLGAIYDAHAQPVEVYLRRLVGDRHEAEDLTQQVFLKLITCLGRYEPRADVPFRNWLLRVAHNVAMDHMRLSRPMPVSEVTEPPSQAPDGDRSRSLHEALDGLPTEQRRVVILRHVAGLSPPEIATALGRTEASVHGLHNRARGQLRRELARREAAPLVHNVERLEAA